MSNNTGGFAFPQSNDRVVAARSIADSQGMTLRDYFAAKALAVALMQVKTYYGIDKAEAATWCYEMADAMLKAREVK